MYNTCYEMNNELYTVSVIEMTMTKKLQTSFEIICDVVMNEKVKISLINDASGETSESAA